MSNCPWDIYAEQLSHLGYGHPLWVPDPPPGSTPVEIGDVGWINEGEFHPLFNAFRGKDEAQPRGGVPVDHVPLDTRDCTIVGPRDKISQSVLCSRSIRRADISGEMSAALTLPNISCDVNFKFTCTDDAGALLFLGPSGRTKDIFSRQLIVDYIEAHFDRWLEFANHRLRLGLSEDQIMFVSGTTKTSRWGVAAFRGATREKKGMVVGNLASVAAIDFSMSILDAQLSTSHYRAGPSVQPASACLGTESLQDQYDQCIFIHYYKRKRKKWAISPSVIKAAAGPHELPRNSDDDESVAELEVPTDSESSNDEFVRFPPPTKVKHTVDHILDYILEHSSAVAAIASDTDLSTLHSIQPRNHEDFATPKDVPDYLATIKPLIFMNRNKLGSFSDFSSGAGGPANSPDSNLLSAVPQSNNEHHSQVICDTTNPSRSPGHLPLYDAPYSQHGGFLRYPSQLILDHTVRSTIKPLPPQPLQSPQIPSPLSSPSNSRGNSPIDYSSMAPSQQLWWLVQPYAGPIAPGPYADSNFVPQVKAVANGTMPYDALYSQDGGYLQDPSHFSLDQFTQQRGLEAGGTTGCDRNKPRHRQSVAKRVGACARCRRLKMKCTFTNPTDDICSRCTAGNYECHFPGRKPRSPGMRVVLQQQIREKNAMIDKVLSQVNPGPTMPTPLTLVPARLPLSEEERNKYRDVLAYIERSTTQAATRIGGDGRPKFDISALEDPSEVDSESDDEMEGLTSPKRGLSPKGEMRPMDSILEISAPTGMTAIAALETRNIAKDSMTNSFSEGSSSRTLVADSGVANESYFLPGPATNLALRRLIVEREAAPDILLSGLVTPDDATALFKIHYQWINSIIPILDENIHTPATVLARSPFLFTIICTVASRYYDEKPHIYGMAMHFAKVAAANAVIDGWKTVETCQAFALWSVYIPPAQRLEEDRAWCYSGITFRFATELNLSRTPERQPLDERDEREALNRTRMWLLCFIIDRFLSIHSGKAWMVQEDATVSNVSRWLQTYRYHNVCDGYLTSLTELLRLVSRFVGMVSPACGTNSVKSVDDFQFRILYNAYDDELLALKHIIDDRHQDEKTAKDPSVAMQVTLVNYVYLYCRLVMCYCGMQLMSQRPSRNPNELSAECIQAATSIVKVMIDHLVPTGFVRYLPEFIYVQAVFAAVLLMKGLKNASLDIQQQERIIHLVKKLIEAWTSSNISLDEKHNTHLYARFLQNLMDAYVVQFAEMKAGVAQTATQALVDGHTPHPVDLPVLSILADSDPAMATLFTFKLQGVWE